MNKEKFQVKKHLWSIGLFNLLSKKYFWIPNCLKSKTSLNLHDWFEFNCEIHDYSTRFNFFDLY